ncbi:uncharacterized protein [Rutidosis leptorrhynchoides]|uniref:uncharacterized protein n=1 Tax=Rutidosis leptorrhynchoides TaxID=125765 RepID=UPI003A9985EC
MDVEDELLIFLIVYCYVRCKIISRRSKRKRDLTSALSGHDYTQELLVGSNTQCHELMRVSRDAYVLLCNHFKQKNWLQDSKHISVEEKIAMFLTVLAQNDRYRAAKYRFQHSLRTIHICFHEVLQGMMQFAREIIGPTSLDDPNVSDRQRYLREMFSGAIGALDGTLVHAIVPNKQQSAYRGRGGGRCYQNVLAICDFNMMFTFVWAGWEGIAHDSRILNEVLYNPTSGFPIPPPNKYYLCDAAYANTRGFLAPYRNTRYWLADFRRRRALTDKEKFNHGHAQLRNVIERSYGVLKGRFPILRQMAPFSFPVQRNVVIACFAIHNFIRKWNIYDKYFMEWDEDTLFDNDEQPEGDGEEAPVGMYDDAQNSQYMANLHDEIAQNLV